MLGNEFQGVKVVLFDTTKSPTPYGLEYKAKGAYKQGKHIIVVGLIKDDGSENTIRIK